MLLVNSYIRTVLARSSRCVKLKNFRNTTYISNKREYKLRCYVRSYSTDIPEKIITPTLTHIPLVFEIKILYLLASKDHSKTYDNLSEVINIISCENKTINEKLLNNIVDYILKEFSTSHSTNLLFKLSSILKIVLEKYFQNGANIPMVASYEHPLLREEKILTIIQLFNKLSVDKYNEKALSEILYETVPLLYRFYYQNYTTIKDYKYGDASNKDDITSFIKLPLLSDTNMLRSISKDNHRLSNGIDIIKLNTLNNNYANRGSGNNYYSDLKFGVFKTGVKNHFTRVNYLPYELKKDDHDITLTFTDKNHVLKQFSNHKIFLKLQIYQIELIIKKLYMYLDGNVDLVDEKTCLTVMNQFFNHIDSFINLDPHQYQSKNRYCNTLLNAIKVSDFPHLHHLITSNKKFIKNMVDKQLFYKVVKRKLIDRKIKYYNFKDIDDANSACLLNNRIIDSVKDKEKYMPYRRLARKKRYLKNKNLFKTIHHYCINYYPRYLLKVCKRDEELAVKIFTSFKSGYLERRRCISNKKLPIFKLKKQANRLLLDPVKQERLAFNKIFNPYTSQTNKIGEDMFIPRNLTLLKLYLKFIYMDLNNTLLFDMNSSQDVHYLTDKVLLLQNFQDDEVFSVEKTIDEAALLSDDQSDDLTKNKLMVKKLLFQLCG